MPPKHQFTENEIADMRRRYESGTESCRDIARVYRVAKNTVRDRLLSCGVALTNGASVIGMKAGGRPSHRRGATHGAESRRRMSAAAIGNQFCLGRRYSPKTIEKMRRSARRRYADPEQREQLLAAGRLGALASAARRVPAPPKPPKEPRAIRPKAPRVYRRPDGSALVRARQRSRYKNLLKALLRRTRRPKISRCAEILGYSRDQFVRHIESKFQPGMSWADRESFHVDHVIPIRVFIARGVTDPRIVNGLCNLRHLPPRANRDKADRYDESRWPEDSARILAGTGYEPVTSL